MATTDANGIIFYETTDPVSPLQTLLNMGQQSVSDAIGARAKIYESAAGSPPSSPADGDMWYQTDTDTLFMYNGTAWQLPNPLSIYGGPGGMVVTITETAVTSCTISVPAGTWRISAKGNTDWSTSGTGTDYAFRLRQGSTAGTELDKSEQKNLTLLAGKTPFALLAPSVTLASTTNIMLTAAVASGAGTTLCASCVIEAWRIR